MSPHPLAPIVALDIDGTTGDYHSHLVKFAEQWTGRKIEFNPDPKQKFNFCRELGMSKHNYRLMKVAYRAGGTKRSMPVFTGAGELTKQLRRWGIQVWICTTRPYQKFDNVDPDTREFLRRNHMSWDHILYGDYKYRDLVKIVGKDRILAVVDDLPEQIVRARKLGLPAIIRQGRHNEHWLKQPETVEQYGDLKVAYSCADMQGIINNWRKERGSARTRH